MNRAQKQIKDKLEDILDGSVLRDKKTLFSFSRDQSIYHIEPLAVVLPRSLEDISNTLIFATNEGISVTARGGGSGTAGSALGKGIVIALEKGGFLHSISELTGAKDDTTVTVGAATIHADLQRFLISNKQFLPADPSSSAFSQIGGNIATKASGPHAYKYGSIANFLQHVTYINPKGELINTDDSKSLPNRLVKKILSISQKLKKSKEASTLLKSRKKFKTASGYNLFPLIEDVPVEIMLAKLFAGHVGTFGFLINATIHTKPYNPAQGTLVLAYKDIAQIADAVTLLRQENVAAIELISRETIKIINLRSRIPGKIILPEYHVLLVEFTGKEVEKQIKEIINKLSKQKMIGDEKPLFATNPEQIDNLWAIRKKILPLLNNPGSKMRALSVVNDIGVPPQHLAPFITEIENLFQKHNLETIIYGHAGSGNLHLRPMFDLSKKGLKKRINNLTDDVYDLVFKYNGTITAEHGMGRLRAPYLKKEWGSEIYTIMKEIKNAFDSQNIMNPDVMFSSNYITDDIQKELLL